MTTRAARASPASRARRAAAAGAAQVAAGYFDGNVKIWDLDTQTAKVTFHGHRSAVTALRYNKDATLLASGSNDTEIVVWDPLSENGVCH